MSDIPAIIQPNDAIPTPRCPLCGAETVLTPAHKAVAAVTDVFRCTACEVVYPVVKRSEN